MMNHRTNSFQVLIGVGSNLSTPENQVKSAIKTIADTNQNQLISTSSIYRSTPQGPQDQGDFYNAVILIKTELGPLQLLSELQSIEQKQGRLKTRHWGERVIDLDILFYDTRYVNLSDPALVIPHPHALTRDFVVIPALEIVPSWVLPDGSLLSEYQRLCIDHQLTKIT
jgi:2-amino-4-hydroxy-6-hydroxymethyldihydropteridine diphosphokinase